MKLLVVILSIIILFFGVRYLLEGFVNQKMYIGNFTETTQPIAVDPEREVSPAGPSPPNAVPKESMATVISQPETATDPYDQPEGEFPMEDNMRQPERSFGPAASNEHANIAVFSGVASDPVQPVHNSFRTFSPEFAQNGGYVDNMIVANDTLDEHNYSAF